MGLSLSLGVLASLRDVMALAERWATEIPDRLVSRWQVTPTRTVRTVVYAGQCVPVDTTSADVSIVLERPTTQNKGREILIHVIRGTNHASITDEGGNAFGKRTSPVAVDYCAHAVSLGDHWELRVL